jgi:hypothetical protein
MPDQRLVNFVIEARKRGCSDLQIKTPLLNNGWTVSQIDKAFDSLNPKFKSKNQICIFLDTEVLKKIEKRAKKNLFTVPEQIEDILRRSCVMGKGSGATSTEKIDDLLVECFSRSRRGRKRKVV